ncbi:hypothetical protein D9619_011995 [Psilocybe cf. subviscida]|uniref:Uncharacterized protein n=1 Tax=Psilocybe cf. subviscida TaxID=2480587 RepID=A0A8H5EW14_9AGAR|nr:hypothetical protein D9619_011995 [Psilocybe cf. subviscida]
MPPTLAVEIYHSIIHSVNTVADLLDLSLCCSTFRAEAQRLLFRHPITDTHAEQMLFILAICSAPERLGPLVHTYTMEYNPGPGGDMEQEAIFIALALRFMCNLKQIDHRASTVMPIIIYKHCKAPLESFNYYRDSNARPDISSLVYEMLPTQPSLTHMIILCSGGVKIDSEMRKAAADLCPNLVSLCVNSRAIGKLFLRRKRHLQSLQWVVGTSTPTCMKVSQYNRLNYLMMSLLTRGLDTSFAPHLSSLTLLELCLRAEWDDDILNSEIQFISDIPHLQYLMIYGGTSTRPQSLEGGQQTECPEIALSAFRMRNTLKHITIGPIDEDTSGYLRVFAPSNEADVIQSRFLSKQEVDAFRIKHTLR